MKYYMNNKREIMELKTFLIRLFSLLFCMLVYSVGNMYALWPLNWITLNEWYTYQHDLQLEHPTQGLMIWHWSHWLYLLAMNNIACEIVLFTKSANSNKLLSVSMIRAFLESRAWSFLQVLSFANEGSFCNS